MELASRENRMLKVKNLKGRKFLFAAAALVLLLALVYCQLFSPVGKTDSANRILFKISGGDDFNVVASRLEQLDLIRSDKALSVYAKLRQLDRKINAGRYPIARGMGMGEILNEITNPKQSEISVVVPEGFSVREIDTRLAKMGLIEPGEFSVAAASSEGYLFPDTYSVYNLNFDPESLLKKMQNNFLKKITPDMLKNIEKKKRTLPEVITMASILEKEVRTEKDYPIVAGILWKRLDSNWPLQADATLLYGRSVTKISGEDLSSNSPYNTRKYKGLPPTPIGNPGLVTIQAAIYPQGSPYWFYLTDKDGNVHYAKTNDEQNKNRKKYLGSPSE